MRKLFTVPINIEIKDDTDVFVLFFLFKIAPHRGSDKAITIKPRRLRPFPRTDRHPPHVGRYRVAGKRSQRKNVYRTHIFGQPFSRASSPSTMHRKSAAATVSQQGQKTTGMRLNLLHIFTTILFIFTYPHLPLEQQPSSPSVALPASPFRDARLFCVSSNENINFLYR